MKLSLLCTFLVFILLSSSIASAAPLEVDSIVYLTSGLPNELSPVWSPDGTEILYGDVESIRKISLADSSQVMLTGELDWKYRCTWSPDGTQIIYLRSNNSGINTLWIMNEDGSSKRQIPNTDDVEEYFAWSPDGLNIAYTNGSELITIEPDGSNKQVIYTNQEEKNEKDGFSVSPFLGDIAWSPDSSKIVFYEYVNENRRQLKVIDRDGRNPISITPASQRLFIAPYGQVWSPDGSKIVYAAFTVNTVNPDGTGQNVLSNQYASSPSFSPDGSKIVYSTGVIWMMNADGSNKIQLTPDPVYYSETPGAEIYTYPVWSPDGTKIAYISSDSAERAGIDQIWIINLKEAFVSDGVITVDDDGGADFTTIQAAVDAANDGDTIRVSPGTYNENVEVDKSVIIKSTDGAEVTNVVGASDNEYVFEVTADETSINGFSISFGPGSDDYYPGKTAIRIFSSSGSRVSNNTIEDCLLGISINKSENIILDGNLLQHNIQGIELTSSIDNDLTGNMISNREYHTAGIVLYYSDHNTLDSNGGSRADIYMYHSNSNVLTNNDAFSYDVLPGIYLSYSNENKIINNNAGGININGEDNILLKDIVYGTMDGHPPIQITGTNNTLINNTAYCTLYSDAGISVSGSNHYLEDNIVADALGTDLYDLNTNPGIILYSTSYSTLTGNIVSKKYGSAISLSSANENLIYNNFFNTSAAVKFVGTNTGNQWNIEKKAGTNIIGGSYIAGNYWAKPDGTGFSQNAVDTNGDGISESPYELDADNIDYLPLTDNVAINQQSTATITSISRISATEGESISFAGNGTDIDGTITGYKWVSSRDGDLGASASFSTTALSVGTHTISFSVKDNDGAWSDADTETITITEAPNQIPTASIVSISPNPVIEGNIVFFSGSGNDIDGTIADYNWESSHDGNLSNSASFSSSDLTVGTHIIYLSVRDDDGEWSNVVSSTLIINDAPVQTGNDSAPVLINVSPTSGSTLAAGTSSVNVLFNYNDTETGVNTNSVIFIFDYVDVTDDGNVTITSTSAHYNATGLEAGNHSAFVYVADNAGNLASFSTNFVISTPSSSTSTSSSSSGGGGGGGGGGSTGETYANIAAKEVDSVFVNKGAHVVYGFNNQGNAISTIEFDSKKNSGSIQTIVEVLKDTSALVDANAPGQVYQQMNIWVGKVGFATENNVENMLITFKVERSWLEDNKVLAESVILYRYSDNIWNKLPTTITREDNEYVYFETETPGFSPFAISGELGETVMSVPDEGAEAVVEELSEVEVTTPKGISTAGILVMLGVISAVLVGGYVLYRKRS